MGKEGAVLYMKEHALFTIISRTVLEQTTAATKMDQHFREKSISDSVGSPPVHAIALPYVCMRIATSFSTPSWFT
jgi:hypothetical protein